MLFINTSPGQKMTNLFLPFAQRHTPGSLPPPPPHRDIQGSGPLVYFLCMNVIGISMFILKPKGMYIMNEFLYYQNEHRANENIECDLDFFFGLFIMLLYVLKRNIMTFQTSLQKNLLDLVTTVCAFPFGSQFNS